MRNSPGVIVILLCIHSVGPFNLISCIGEQASFSIAISIVRTVLPHLKLEQMKSMILPALSRVTSRSISPLSYKFPHLKLVHSAALLLNENEVPFDASLISPGEDILRADLSSDGHVVPVVRGRRRGLYIISLNCMFEP